jgi:hypothetical protein
MLIRLWTNTFFLFHRPTLGMETLFSIFKILSSLIISHEMTDGVYDTKLRITLSSVTLCIIKEYKIYCIIV